MTLLVGDWVVGKSGGAYPSGFSCGLTWQDSSASDSKHAQDGRSASEYM